ncbi:MAG TPA: OsmC family protein [Baekduia sp.]|uniref:OsmC family protein n=1 Tax=Baekduia sp. TaxID=2600305 RepID=UPI002D1AAD00|nr:OsmC family protein [Baekduia sp.]HMJ37302.1 OsmC family protein [Baekduia sp.]
MPDRLEVTAVWRGGWATDVTARGHAIRVDEPASAGGGDTGLMPTELLCAALASCFCLAVAYAARKDDLDVRGLSVAVTAERAGTELRYGRIKVETSAALDDETLARLVRRARPLCWVSNTLAEGVSLEYSRTSRNAHFRR